MFGVQADRSLGRRSLRLCGGAAIVAACCCFVDWSEEPEADALGRGDFFAHAGGLVDVEGVVIDEDFEAVA